MNINDNINQFGIYASDIFLHLYDRFPIVLALKSKDIIRPYLDLALDKDIKELQITIDMADLIEVTSGLTEEQKRKLKELSKSTRIFGNQKNQTQIHRSKYIKEPCSFLKKKVLFVKQNPVHIS